MHSALIQVAILFLHTCTNLLVWLIISSAFKAGGEPELIIFSSIKRCHSFCIRYEPAVPVMTPQLTHMHAGTVVSLVLHLCRYKHHKTAVQSADQLFHTGVSGILPGHYSFAVSV